MSDLNTKGGKAEGRGRGQGGTEAVLGDASEQRLYRNKGVTKDNPGNRI